MIGFEVEKLETFDRYEAAMNQRIALGSSCCDCVLRSQLKRILMPWALANAQGVNLLVESRSMQPCFQSLNNLSLFCDTYNQYEGSSPLDKKKKVKTRQL